MKNSKHPEFIEGSKANIKIHIEATAQRSTRRNQCFQLQTASRLFLVQTSGILRCHYHLRQLAIRQANLLRYRLCKRHCERSSGEHRRDHKPSRSPNVAGVVLSVLSAGPKFLDLPAKAAGTVTQAVQAAATKSLVEFKARTLALAIQQAPGLAKPLSTPATLSGQFVEVNEISDPLAAAVTAL